MVKLVVAGDKDLGSRKEMESGEGKNEVPGASLVKTVASVFSQHHGLETSPNRLDYPTSRFENVRKGFGGAA